MVLFLITNETDTKKKSLYENEHKSQERKHG